jgi:hypothetical protein
MVHEHKRPNLPLVYATCEHRAPLAHIDAEQWLRLKVACHFLPINRGDS